MKLSTSLFNFIGKQGNQPPTRLVLSNFLSSLKVKQLSPNRKATWFNKLSLLPNRIHSRLFCVFHRCSPSCKHWRYFAIKTGVYAAHTMSLELKRVGCRVV